MRTKAWVVCCLLAFGLPSAADAQLGMDLFKRPAITKAFHPVAGKGVEYETSKRAADGKATSMEIGIVGKESVDGNDGYWMEFVSSGNRGSIGKSPITLDDFQFHKMIIQPPGQGAMELPMNISARNRESINEKISDWHSVGTETVTVPSGTFTCEHWKNEKEGAEASTSDRVAPFGLVKEVEKNNSMTLLKVLDDFPERIAAPVKPFDTQQMMRQMQQQKQKQQGKP